MKATIPVLLHMPAWGKDLIEKMLAVAEQHETPPQPITVEEIDSLIDDTSYLKEVSTDLGLIATEINKMIQTLEQKGGHYLRALGREEYRSPFGFIEIGETWKFRMPKTAEDKNEFFEFLKTKPGLFEEYATVQSNKLNAFATAAWKKARKEDPEQWICFSIPGLPPVARDEFTTIKGNDTRKSKKKKKESEDDDSEE